MVNTVLLEKDQGSDRNIQAEVIFVEFQGSKKISSRSDQMATKSSFVFPPQPNRCPLEEHDHNGALLLVFLGKYCSEVYLIWSWRLKSSSVYCKLWLLSFACFDMQSWLCIDPGRLASDLCFITGILLICNWDLILLLFMQCIQTPSF